jgi:hypothetical protein
VNPPDQHQQDIQRGLIGPMEVLEHENAGPTRSQLAGQRGYDLVRCGTGPDEPFEVLGRQRHPAKGCSKMGNSVAQIG